MKINSFAHHTSVIMQNTKNKSNIIMQNLMQKVMLGLQFGQFAPQR